MTLRSTVEPLSCLGSHGKWLYLRHWCSILNSKGLHIVVNETTENALVICFSQKHEGLSNWNMKLPRTLRKNRTKANEVSHAQHGVGRPTSQRTRTRSHSRVNPSTLLFNSSFLPFTTPAGLTPHIRTMESSQGILLIFEL